MKLSRPAAPFERVGIHGESFTLDTSGKVLVLPTGSDVLLPSFNEYVLNSNRLTIAESPLGGLKGSGSPDYAPGTVNVVSGDGIYLTDTSGTNSTKTLTAGKLKSLGLLTVDTAAHSITEEFIVENTATSNSPTVIHNCNSATNWAAFSGTVSSITSDGSKITVAGTTSELGYLGVQFALSNQNLTAHDVVTISLNPSSNCNLFFSIGNNTNNRSEWKQKNSMLATANTNNIYALAYKGPANNTTGNTPLKIIGTPDFSAVALIAVGIQAVANTSYTYVFDNITADTAKTATIELQTPNNLSATSTIIQCYAGSTYSECRRDSLDSTYSNVSSTPANMKMLDGTKFDDVYGSGLGRAYFPKGSAAETKAGSSGNITYSANKGTDKRIGLMVSLPPYDGRTDFNKVRLKVITYYTDTVGNVVPDLSGNNNTGTIVGGVTKLNEGGLKFNMGTSSVSMPDNTALRMSAGGTINAWIYPISIGVGAYGRIIDKSAGLDGENGYILYTEGTNGLCFKANAVDPRTISSNNAITLNQWQYVSVDFDSAGKKLFINLVDVTNTGGNNTTLPPNVAGIVTIGNRTASLDRGFDGNIRDITYYNRILTPAEKEAAKNGNPPSNGLIYRGLNSVPVNMGSTTHQFADSTNASYGLQNLSKPWIALYSPTSNLIDFYLFTHRPKQLEYKRDETGTIYELKLYPGNGQIYHGQITYSDLARDTNSDLIPDCLEAAVNGSVTKFLEHYTMEV